ncbi:hypothetical protein SYNPS1DRAFT_30327 [Syncephalis pseudoplumigaleata]|uniref:Uncharacterized protein n=1 Tax=Syncephalis pseudoplumigaleata TaxID=1712513 RepID=A0A4P9YY44_9FUNG|nr:hypothetical protein SYNPS1DRAFT_30327 [Syncephalis pseudoplumigaleata]|eukprot:RKP23910.1 hypothetical protein SYNPS1DRAFT_30327 [Syncephalis pseudoplumigaleata]
MGHGAQAINIPIIIDEASVIIESDHASSAHSFEAASDDVPAPEKEEQKEEEEEEEELTSPVAANAQWHTSVSIATFEENLAHIKQSADEADEAAEPSHEDASSSLISGDISSMASFHPDDDDEDDEGMVITTDILERETAKALEQEATMDRSGPSTSPTPEDPTEEEKEHRKSTLAILVEEAATEGGVCASEPNHSATMSEQEQEEQDTMEITEPMLSNDATSNQNGHHHHHQHHDGDEDDDSIDAPFGHAMMASSTMQSCVDYTSTPQLPPTVSIEDAEPMQHESSHHSIVLQATSMPLPAAITTTTDTLPLVASDDWPPVSADDESVFSPILPEDAMVVGSFGSNKPPTMHEQIDAMRPATATATANSLAVPTDTPAKDENGDGHERTSLHMIRRSRTFGDSDTSSKASSSKKKSKSKKQAGETTAGALTVTPLAPSTQWNAADLHQGQAMLTPSHLTPTAMPLPIDNANMPIDPSGAWSLSRSLDSGAHPLDANVSPTTMTHPVAHPMMISRSMGHQRHHSSGSHGGGSYTYGHHHHHHHPSHYPARSHRFNSLDHKLDPDRLLSLTATVTAEGAGRMGALLDGEGWSSLDGTRWIPPAETPSLTSTHHWMHHRAGASIDESYAALASATPTASTPLATTALGRHLLEGYNREIHAVLGGSLGTTMSRGMRRSISEQWPAATPMAHSSSTMSIDPRSNGKHGQDGNDDNDNASGGAGGDRGAEGKGKLPASSMVDPLLDAYSPLTDTFSMALSESYDSYHPPRMGDMSTAATTTTTTSTASMANGSSEAGEGATTAAAASYQQPPATPTATRKFMRKLSFVNQAQVSHMATDIHGASVSSAIASIPVLGPIPSPRADHAEHAPPRHRPSPAPHRRRRR